MNFDCNFIDLISNGICLVIVFGRGNAVVGYANFEMTAAQLRVEHHDNSLITMI